MPRLLLTSTAVALGLSTTAFADSFKNRVERSFERAGYSDVTVTVEDGVLTVRSNKDGQSIESLYKVAGEELLRHGLYDGDDDDDDWLDDDDDDENGGDDGEEDEDDDHDDEGDPDEEDDRDEEDDNRGDDNEEEDREDGDGDGDDDEGEEDDDDDKDEDD